MDIEPKTLGVSLQRRHWSPYWFALACAGLGTVTIHPTSVSEWIVALSIVGPAFWVSFGGPYCVYRWQQHSLRIVRGLVGLLRLAFVAIVLWYVAPFAVSFINSVLHA